MANGMERCGLLQAATGVAVGMVAASLASARTVATPSTAPAGGGDFAFLAGEWKIAQRRLADGKWDEFPGEATVHSLLGGLASIEELRIPARNFFGVEVRSFHQKERKWADHWMSAGNGVVNDPMMGSFAGGVGTFLAEEEIEGGGKLIARGVWDRVTPTSCRWHQSTSSDGGKSWDYNWYMDWTWV
ncbi:hypothetical protein ACFOMD_00335 [Sphingoaurantiacus capsulatus]|uniref:DUF1579 domain-containing protein n=1 Tax=Sphingoaurantiacus capsulatus TaxID=1771310 RepID=A0ABV7X6P5_9SPHN